MPQETKHFYEFSSFRLDAARRVLLMEGKHLALAPKVFDTLLVLVQRRGQVVEKDELMKLLWPDSFVEEANLTQNVSLLRKVLGEGPYDHHYIVTVPGRGYRFVAEVTKSGDEETQLIIEERIRAHIVVSEEEKASEPKQIGRASLATEDQLASSHEPAVAISGKSGLPVLVRPRIAVWLLRLTGALVSALVVVGLGWYVWQRTGPSTELTQRQLTTNSSETPATAAAISPDGKYIAYADKSGIYLRLLETGEMHPLPTPPGSAIFALAWFPEGTKLLASGGAGQPIVSSIWAISILGGAPRKLRDDAGAASVSPDGTHIAFTSGTAFGNNGKEIWLMGANGEERHRIVAATEGNSFPGALWFPNGQRLLYGRIRLGADTAEVTIESRDLKGGPANVILSDLRLTGGCLLPDGRIIYSMAEPPPNDNDANLWEIRIDTRTGQASTKPRRITSWTGFSLPGLFSVTADGKHVAFLKRTAQADVYVGELKGNGARLESSRRLTLNDRNDFAAAWTPDSKAVLFQSDRNGNFDIFKQTLGLPTAEAVVAGAEDEQDPVVSPDGSWILYLVAPKAEDGSPAHGALELFLARRLIVPKTEEGPSAPRRLMRVPTSGGARQFVLTTRGGYRCAQLPSTLCVLGEESTDKKQLVFTAFDPVQGKSRELTRVDVDPANSWDLSPDGLQIAITLWEANRGRIQILPLAGGRARDITVSGWSQFTSINWSSDGKGWYIGSQAARAGDLLYVDLKSRAQVLQRQVGSFQSWGFPSPDGRHLAFTGWNSTNNVWMIENF